MIIIITLITITLNGSCDWLVTRGSERKLVPFGIVAVEARGSDEHGANDATGRAIPSHSVRHCLLDQGSSLGDRHVGAELGIDESPNIGASTAAQGKGHFETGSSQRNGVAGEAIDGVIPRNDDSGQQLVLVFVGEPFQEVGRGANAGRAPRFHRHLLQKVLDVVGQCLRVGGTPAPTGEDRVVQLHDFVRRAVGNVGARRHSRVCSQNDAVLAGNGHDGGSRRHFTRFQTRVVRRRDVGWR